MPPVVGDPTKKKPVDPNAPPEAAAAPGGDPARQALLGLLGQENIGDAHTMSGGATAPIAASEPNPTSTPIAASEPNPASQAPAPLMSTAEPKPAELTVNQPPASAATPKMSTPDPVEGLPPAGAQPGQPAPGTGYGSTPSGQWAATVDGTDPRDAAVGGKHVGMAPDGAHQNADGSWDWNSPAAGTPAAGPASATAAPAAAPAAAATPTAPPAAAAAPAAAPEPANPLETATRSKLLGLINPDAITAESLAQSPEAAAERLQSQRGADRQRSQAAEQMTQQGLGGTGGAAGVMRGISQNQGEQDAGFIGQLATTKIAQQIDQTKFAIQQATQMGQFDKAQALQQRLAQMQDATTRFGVTTGAETARYGIDTGAKTAAGQQGVERYGIDTGAKTAAGQQGVERFGITTGAQTAAGAQEVQRHGIDTQAATAAGGLGLGYAQLGQQGSQFDDTLGYNYSALQTQANRDALLAMLNGGA